MKLLFDYYPEASIRAAGYRLLRFYYGDREFLQPAVRPVDAVGLHIPLLAGFEHIHDSTAPAAPEIDPELRDRYLARLTASGARLWDDDLYCITEFQADRTQVRFAIATGRFLAYRTSVALLREETAIALETGQVRMPLRDQIAPDMAAFTRFDWRMMGGGVHLQCAFRRPAPENDYVLLLQKRSTLVSEARGQLGVVPMAFHQPAPYPCGTLDPRSPATTALREVAEELFGWPEERSFLEHPAIGWLLAERDRIHLEMTSFFVSLVGGGYDFSTVLIVPDAGFWQAFGAQLLHGWESDGHLLVSSRDTAAIGSLLMAGNWEAQAQGAFVEGLLRLREIDPNRMAALPLVRPVD